MTRPLITILIVLALAPGCNDPLPEQTPRKRALESITHAIFEPMLDAVVSQAERLDQAARDLCEPDAGKRTKKDLEAAQKAWGEACERWKRTDVMAFGPHLMSPYRFAEDIDFWPVREDSIDALLSAGSGQGDEDGGVEPGADAAVGLPMLPSTPTASQKGLPAIEYLLFGPRDRALASFQDGERGDQRCAYLRRMTDVLLSDTRELARVFREEFAPDFTLEHSPNERYKSVNEAFGELINNMVFAVETVRGTRLARPLGLSVGEVPQPELVESRYSDESIRDAIAVLDGVSLVFLGAAPEGSEASEPIHGIHSVLAERKLDLRDEYRARHGAAEVEEIRPGGGRFAVFALEAYGAALADG